MIMFGMLKEKLGGGAKRLSGRTDLLEATCAACALVAAADGEIEDSELVATQEALVNHPTLSTAFKQSEIEATASKIFSRAKGTMGRIGLMKEIEQAKSKSTSDDLELILAVAVDISRADGEMEPQELAVLQKVANTLGLNLRAFLDA
jgi:tellurite resistance protein TerB